MPTKTTWNKLLKDLRPIIIFGYKSATPQVKKLYREVMAMEGLTFK